MDFYEFIKNHGKYYFVVDGLFHKMELQQYQIDFIDAIQKYKFVLALKPRQMYFSTLMAHYIAWFLLFNKNKKKNKIIFVATSKFMYLIRDIVVSYDANIKFVYDNKRRLKLSNENEVITPSNLSEFFNTDNLAYMIIDEAAFYNIENIPYDSINNSKLIMYSSLNVNPNEFINKFVDNNNKFHKMKFKWSDDKNKTIEWYNNMVLNVGKKWVASEIDVVIPDTSKSKVNKNNKNNIITLRLDDDTMNKIGRKLITLDKILSDYLRDLIEKDLQ